MERYNEPSFFKGDQYWILGMVFFMILLWVSSHHDLKGWQPKHTSEDSRYNFAYAEIEKSCNVISKLEKYKGTCSKALASMPKPMKIEASPRSTMTNIIFYVFGAYIVLFTAIAIYHKVIKQEQTFSLE